MKMDTKTSNEPFDRLTELSAKMTEVLDLPQNADVKAIIFLNDPKRGGIQFHGYKDTTEGLADLFVHMKAVFNSQGKRFGVMTDQGVMMMDPEE